jgi:hypothetical protein
MTQEITSQEILVVDTYIAETILTEESQIVAIELTDNVVIAVGEQGPIGAKGDKGDKGAIGEAGSSGITLFAYPAGDNLSGHRLLQLGVNGTAIYADSSDVSKPQSILGVSTGAASLGGVIYSQPFGELEEPSWNWTPDLPIFLGIAGLITQTPPLSGFSLIIGYPITPTKIFISIRDPIYLN